MPFRWRRTASARPAVFERRDDETEWVVIEGRRVGYLYRMWRHCLACTATQAVVFSNEAAAVTWLADQDSRHLPERTPTA